MVLVLVNCGLSPEEAIACVLTDDEPAPTVRPGYPIWAPYVDNANFVFYDAADCARFLRSFLGLLGYYRLAHRVECPGAAVIEALGVILDVSRRLL